MYIHTSTGEKTVYWVVIRQIGDFFNQHNATNSKNFTGQLLYLLDYRAYTWQITAKSRTNVHLADNNKFKITDIDWRVYAFWGCPHQHCGGVLSLFDSFFVSSGHSYPLHEGHCLTDMWLGCPAKFFLCDSPCQLYCIGSMDAEEDDQDFRFLDSAVYSLQSVMFLLWTQNLVLFQKIVVPLPWRLFFVSPKTGPDKQFGGFFVIICKDT